MDDIAVSLFQDVGTIQFNSNDEQHQDEEEEHEERKRRDEEIHNCLEGVFNDLSECNSVNSTQCNDADFSMNSTSSKFHTAEKNNIPIHTNYDLCVPNMIKDIPSNISMSPCNNYAKFNHRSNHSFDNQLRDQNYTTPSSRYSDHMYPNNGHTEDYDALQSYRNQSNDIHCAQNLIPLQSTNKHRETESLKKLMNQKDEEINNLKRELMIKQDQIEECSMSKKEVQQFLDDAKAEIDYLQSQVKALTEGNEVQNNTIKKLSEDLSISQTLRIDLQSKIDMLENAQLLQSNNDKLQEQFMKQAQDKSAIEVKNLQNKIDQLTTALDGKEVLYVSLEQKFEELRKRHENYVIENVQKINNLTQALHDSQAQCTNLVTSNNSRELIHLQTQLEKTLKEKEELLHKVENLKHKLIIAHNDDMQYLTLLRHTTDEQSDSIRQMELGSAKSKSNKDDIVFKLREELNRCLEGQQLKRKEINRLETILAQKQKDLDEALANANAYHQEASEYAERVNQLEAELKSVLSDKAKKADSKIKKLSDHLDEMKKQNESLRTEKKEIENKLEETLSINHELSSKLLQNTVNDDDLSATLMNKEYLDLHEKAVQKIKEEAEVKLMQLEVQLEQTQKSLDHVKQSYINICASKEQLINEHKQEMQTLVEKYGNLDLKEQILEKREQELVKQTKLVEILSNDCEKYRNKIIELEKDIELEKRKKTEHAKLIHMEIEKAKEEALKELRSAHPNHVIDVHLPNYCSEHVDKITELENDCKRLEEKLSAAVEDQRKLSDLQAEVDNVRLNLAQTEINKEAWIKKYESSQKEIMKIQSKYDQVLVEKNNYQEKLLKLEEDLTDAKNQIENNLKAQASEKLDDELSRLRNKSKDSRVSDNLTERIKQLEKDVQMKEEKVKEMDKIKDERDELVTKLKNQSKQFKQFLKNQKQVSVELNTPSGIVDDSAEAQKNKEMQAIKDLREEMEQKVRERLKERMKEIENNHQLTLSELKKDCESKTKELESLKENIETEKIQLQASFKKQVQIVQTRIGEQLLSRKFQIEEMQEKLTQKENDIEKERNVMAQLLSNWSSELKIIQNREMELREELRKIKSSEESLAAEVKSLKDQKQEIHNSLKAVKKKYRCAKEIASNYKEHAEKNDKRFRNERKWNEESYKQTMNQIQNKVDTINLQDKEVTKKMRDIEAGHAESLKKLRLEYKHKC